MTIEELEKKIKEFEKKSGLKLYYEILDDIYRLKLRIEDLRKSREKWKEKYYSLKGNRKVYK